MTETPELPNGKFDLIYADPPWSYDFQESKSRMIENHYPTMAIDEIKALDIPAAEDSVCYLWTTSPKLKEGIDTLEEWGFEYRTNAMWDKKKIAQGYWFRGQHEILLVGRRGDYSPPDESRRRSSVFRERAQEHSKKPKKVREHIEKAHPDADKLELFSRDGRVGWTMWGNEAVEKPQDKLESYV